MYNPIHIINVRLYSKYFNINQNLYTYQKHMHKPNKLIQYTLLYIELNIYSLLYHLIIKHNSTKHNLIKNIQF